MFAIAAILLAGDPVAASAERAAWYDCLDSYAQVAMLSAASPVRIALGIPAVCEGERKAFQLKLLRSRKPADAQQGVQAFNALVADEDREAARHVIAFVRRNR